MQYLAVFMAILKFLENVLPILKDLFAKAKGSDSAEGWAPKDVINEAFDRARAQTYPLYHFWTRRGIEAARRQALKRAPELVAAARGTAEAPKLSAFEQEDIRMAAGL